MTKYSAGRIEFVYTATGEKLRKTVIQLDIHGDETSREVYDYMGEYVYKNKVLSRILNTEGSVVRHEKGFFSYEYSLKDHLGNTRVTFSDENGDGNIDPNTEVSQINHYYPFGLNMEGNWNGAAGANKYAYNGKEWNDDFGLGWNDYGARFYDPAIGRFPVVDRFAEKYLTISPYQYGRNNPVKYIDINGDSTIVGIYVNGGNNNQTATALYQGAADGNVFLLFLQNNTVQLPKNVKTFSQIAAYAKSNGSTLIQASSGHPIYYKASGDSKWLINKTQTEYGSFIA